MLKVGLCGKIASGKSSVENILIKKGIPVIDLDNISHELLLNDEEIKKKVLKEFNTLSRLELGKIVFNDAKKRKLLENIIHPKLKKYILNLFKTTIKKAVFVSGALLFEAGFDKLFDKIIFIDANDDIRLNRLVKRNNLDIINAKKRMDAQQTDYKNKADFIIENNSTLDELEKRIDAILRQLKIVF